MRKIVFFFAYSVSAGYACRLRPISEPLEMPQKSETRSISEGRLSKVLQKWLQLADVSQLHGKGRTDGALQPLKSLTRVLLAFSPLGAFRPAGSNFCRSASVRRNGLVMQLEPATSPSEVLTNAIPALQIPDQELLQSMQQAAQEALSRLRLIPLEMPSMPKLDNLKPELLESLKLDRLTLDKLESIDVASLLANINRFVVDFAQGLPSSSDILADASAQIGALVLYTQAQIAYFGANPASYVSTLSADAVVSLTVGLVAVAALSTLRDQDGAPYPEGVYDADAARAFFLRRPLEVVARAVLLFARSAGFGLALLGDAASGKLESLSEQRASELATLLTELGPTFIKAGQSASIRADLVPPAYIRGLTQLQDQVPPFPSEKARAIIAEEFNGVFPFGHLSEEPIAAASLGQVYKGTLLNGTEVAVKVQRPNMVRQIALDMLLIRDFAAPLAKAFGVPGDLIGTADAWGKGFVDELNYQEEAANAQRFNRDVSGGPLDGRVFAPCVVSEASGRRVLTTVWIDGERLDRCSEPGDVPRLCSVTMNTYMEMMLDTGVLHCDPHPGNLLRTSDGQLCILDWGLVTCIRPDIRLSLIEHVAHLTAKDYDKVPSDLVKLEFVPDGAEESVFETGVMDFLRDVYSTRSLGGGFKRFDVPKVLDELNSLAAGTENGLFQIPPYFAYIAKAFSVLEGIGLAADPEYNIIGETLPYISRRILTDPSPRTAGALETFVFGDDKEDVQSRVLDAGRVETLIDGAKRYAASVSLQPSTANTGEATSPLTIAGLDVDEAADAIFDVLLSKEASPLQDIILEQLALVIGAASREAWADLRERSGRSDSSGRSFLGTLVDPLGLFKGSRLVEADERDRKVLDAASKLASIASELLPNEGLPGTASEPNTGDARRLVEILMGKLLTRQDELQEVSRRLARRVLDQTAKRVLFRGS